MWVTRAGWEGQREEAMRSAWGGAEYDWGGGMGVLEDVFWMLLAALHRTC